MKTKIKLLTISLLIVVGTCITTNAKADDPPPPPPGHGSTGNVPGGGAPIGGGLLILLGMGSIYGAYKFLKQPHDKALIYKNVLAKQPLLQYIKQFN